MDGLNIALKIITQKDKTENALAAIKYTINFYEKNKKELGKISTIEKFIKKKNKPKLCIRKSITC